MLEQAGVFDTGGLQSIANVQVTNGSVEVGADPGSSFPYLKFVPGQTGPLFLSATRNDNSLPMHWSLDATDTAGNTSTCTGVETPPSAADDAYGATEDSPLTVVAPGVLANDSDADLDPVSAVAAGDPANGSVTLSADGSFTYTPDADFAGTDTFSYTAGDGTGATGTGTVTVTVAATADAPVAVDDTYSTSAGTPLPVAAPGVLSNDTDADGDVLSAGSASDPPNGSVGLNADGSFTYTPDSGFSGTDAFGYTTTDGNGGSDTAIVTITVTAVAPAGPPTLSIADLSVAEGNAGTTTATFTVTRSGSASGVSTVKYKTSGGTATAGTDYTAVPLTTLTFAPGQTTRTVDVSITGDIAPEAAETLNLVLSAPSSGTVIADTTGVATVVNDDGTAYVTVDSVTVNEGSPAIFTITRSGATAGTSTVSYKTSGGTAAAGVDYTALGTATATFAPGETSKSITVDVAGDGLDEANETFNLMLSGPSAATVLSDASGTTTIVDDDGPVTAGPSTFLSIGDLSVAEGDAGTTAATFTITRSGTTSGSSTVKYKTSGGTATAGADYNALALTSVTFAPGQTAKTITVDVVGDGLAEANETFNLALSGATGAVIADTSGTATIGNDDGAAYLAVANTAVTEGDSGTAAATFTIFRSGNTAGSSTVSVKTSGGTATAGGDYVAMAPTTVTFGPGETTRTVTVNVTGDTAVEPAETFNLVLSAAANATISDSSGTATVVNDD